LIAGWLAAVCVCTDEDAISVEPQSRQKRELSLLACPHAGQAYADDANPPSDPD